MDGFVDMANNCRITREARRDCNELAANQLIASDIHFATRSTLLRRH
jgi:hypothetical protein